MRHGKISSMAPQIALVDPMCKTGYRPTDLAKGVLGGTEATVLRVAARLKGRVNFSHYQAGRREAEATEAGQMHPLEDAASMGRADGIIVINSWKLAVRMRKSHPGVPIHVWLHVFPGRHNRPMGRALRMADIGLICVSKSHAEQLGTFLGAGPKPQITWIYNPIADDLAPRPVSRDPNLLLFCSSPHKGLQEVFERFTRLRREMPQLRLAVADPGYLRWDAGPPPENAVFLGNLTHEALIAQMRQALCLFYAQTGFAETFGLVMAEASAVGTPVLAHRGLGANNEILNADFQGSADGVIDCTDPVAIASTIHRWQASPPSPTANPQFRLKSVARRWERLLSGGMQACDFHPAMQEA